MNTNHFWRLIGGLAVCFALPWALLIVGPYISEANTQPVPYTEEEMEIEGVAQYPDRSTLRFGESDYGAKVYAAEGCAYCHTQMVRPTYAGPDMWRSGWGGRDSEKLNRETRPEDYFGEGFAYLGYQRLGQDLSNVGHRITSREDMHRHLYDPKSFDKDSGMPRYIHLYEKSELTGKYVPSSKANALVDYLMSRKKDAKIPEADNRNG
jgi:cytochrome c oxidase cbb3-type subunit 2